MASTALPNYTSQTDYFAYKKPTTTRLPRTTTSTAATAAAAVSIPGTGILNASPNEDETFRECLLFPTYAFRHPQKSSEWVIRTRGWALSHNRSLTKQRFVTSITKGVVGQSSGDQAVFEERFKYFLAKNKRNKHFVIQATTTLPFHHSDNITMRMTTRRDSNGSTDSGFQSAELLDKDEQDDNDDDDDEGVFVTDSIYTMERPANPLSSILSGRRMQSTTSIPSSLSSNGSSDSQSYHGDNEEDDDEDDDIIDNYDNEPMLKQNQSRSLTYPSFINDANTTTTATALTKKPKQQQKQEKIDGQATFKTESSGFFSGLTHLSHRQVLQWAKEKDCCDARLLQLKATSMDHPVFSSSSYSSSSSFPVSHGMVNLIEPTGISIISDIDDTIKETQILHGARTVLGNTFFKPSKDVDGMAEAYMKWYTQGASFHYVSNSPFQLLPFLHQFLNTSQFPPGSMHLRLDGSIMARLIEIPGRAKRDAILGIMNDFPLRQFVLVGDSGEIDLEIYTKIALEHPGRILKIFIHDVTTPYAEYKRSKKNTTESPTSPTSPTSPSTATSTTGFPSLLRNNSISFSSLFQSSSTSSSSSASSLSTPSSSPPSSTSSSSFNQHQHHLPYNNKRYSSFSTIMESTPSSAFSPPTEKLISSASFSYETQKPNKDNATPSDSNKQNTIVELASSFTSSSILGLGRGRTKSLAELVLEPSLSTLSSSSSSSSSSAASVTNGPGPSQQCMQLYDRVRKAQDQLPNVEVILFQKAQELRDDTTIQDALWQHWDDQCMNTKDTNMPFW